MSSEATYPGALDTTRGNYRSPRRTSISGTACCSHRNWLVIIPSCISRQHSVVTVASDGIHRSAQCAPTNDQSRCRTCVASSAAGSHADHQPPTQREERHE